MEQEQAKQDEQTHQTEHKKEMTAAELNSNIHAFDYILSVIFPATKESYQAVYQNIILEAERLLNESLRIQIPGNKDMIPIRFVLLPVDKVELDKLVPFGVEIERKLEIEPENTEKKETDENKN